MTTIQEKIAAASEAHRLGYDDGWHDRGPYGAGDVIAAFMRHYARGYEIGQQERLNGIEFDDAAGVVATGDVKLIKGYVPATEEAFKESDAANAWWRCPNDPPCDHGAIFHDIHELDDPSPRCCVEGCPCGAGVVATGDNDQCRCGHPRSMHHTIAEVGTEQISDDACSCAPCRGFVPAEP